MNCKYYIKTLMLSAFLVIPVLMAMGGEDEAPAKRRRTGTALEDETTSYSQAAMSFVINAAGSYGAEIPSSDGEARSSSASIGQLQSAITVIPVECGNIYTAKIRLPSGDAYFGYEPIIDHRWKKYKDDSIRCCRLLIKITENLLKISTDEEIAAENIDEETIKFLKSLITTSKYGKKLGLLECRLNSCIHGVKEMKCDEKKHIAYISSRPIDGFCHLPSAANGFITGEDNHILMSVSVFGDRLCTSGTDRYYEHRGISRNPMSFLRGDYKNISLLLHSFAGLVSLGFRDFKYMVVNPNDMDKMQSLIKNNFEIEPSLKKECPECTLTVSNHFVLKTQDLAQKFLQARESQATGAAAA